LVPSNGSEKFTSDLPRVELPAPDRAVLRLVRVGDDDTGLLSAVQQLRSEVENATFPLDLPGVATARLSQSALLKELDDYVIPRLVSLDAPLLAVVGGSTGAGKSTLVNSLVGSVVSRSGVLRPTTRSPVLVHHPQDERWFKGSRVLPGLARMTGFDDFRDDQAVVRLVSSETLPAGLAVLDAPDIDSVVQSNREVARELLLAADLWLFVTTAARYADAVPWDLLRGASERGTSVAIVLNRVPPEAMEEVRAHLASMLRERGLASAPIFTAMETTLTADGRLSEREIARLRSWLSALARDAKARSIVVRRTLTGALKSLHDSALTMSVATVAQEGAAGALHQEVAASYAAAMKAVELGMTDGTLLRGEVLARWQEFVGTGEFLRHVEAGVSRLRDRISAVIKGSPPPTSDLGEALQSGVAELLTAQSRGALAAVLRRWRQLPGGPEVVAAHPELGKPSPDGSSKVERLVRDWQGQVLDLVRAEGRDRRTTARVLSFGANGIGVILMLLVFSQTGGITGAEVGIAGGSALLAQRILEAIFGDQAVRDLATKARRQLMAKAEELYDGEQARLHAAVASVEVGAGQAERLRAAASAVEVVR
jgi:energy-coupling factor transporter ATP-binding protein EcfA2